MKRKSNRDSFLDLCALGIPLRKWFKAVSIVGPILVAVGMFYTDVQTMKESLNGLEKRLGNIEISTNTILQNIIGGNPNRDE